MIAIPMGAEVTWLWVLGRASSSKTLVHAQQSSSPCCKSFGSHTGHVSSSAPPSPLSKAVSEPASCHPAGTAEGFHFTGGTHTHSRNVLG